MALSTLLQIINRAEDELKLSRSATVIGNTAQQARTLLAIANDVGRELMESYEWPALMSSTTFNTVSGTALYTLSGAATDFDRLIPDTLWDQTEDRKLVGPDTAQVNRALREGIGNALGAYTRFRMASATQIHLVPTPTSVRTIVYEHISTKWARAASGGAAQVDYEADGDTSVFDAFLLKDGIKLYYRGGSGLYADPEYKKWQERCQRRLSAVRANGRMSMSPQAASPFLSLDNVADNSWDLDP